jgi:hypothetical protein
MLSGIANVDPSVAAIILGGSRQYLLPGSVQNQVIEQAGNSATDQKDHGAGALARVRQKLYERYPDQRSDVDAAIGGSDFIGSENVNELDAYALLDDALRATRAGKTGRRQSQPPEPKSQSELESHGKNAAKKLGKNLVHHGSRRNRASD